MRRVLMLLGITAVLVPITAGPSWACSCVQASPREHARMADVIVAGHVEELTEGAQIDVARLAVTDVYKGPRTSAWTVETAAEGPACGYDFVEGRRYTVFGSLDGGTLSTSLCTATTAGDIDPERFGLDSPERVQQPPAGREPDPPSGSRWPWAAVAGGAVAGAFAAALVVRRTRKPRTLP